MAQAAMHSWSALSKKAAKAAKAIKETNPRKQSNAQTSVQETDQMACLSLRLHGCSHSGRQAAAASYCASAPRLLLSDAQVERHERRRISPGEVTRS